MTKKGFRHEDLPYEEREELNKKRNNEEQKELTEKGNWWEK